MMVISPITAVSGHGERGVLVGRILCLVDVGRIVLVGLGVAVAVMVDVIVGLGVLVDPAGGGPPGSTPPNTGMSVPIINRDTTNTNTNPKTNRHGEKCVTVRVVISTSFSSIGEPIG